MCGIYGFYRLNADNHKRLDFERVVNSFEETMLRGKDATGFYSPSTGTVKDGVEASKFCEEHKKVIKKAIEDGIMVAHCRASTTGFRNKYAGPAINHNNHPHEGKRFVLVHNGIYKHLPPLKKYKYKGECDSELALSYVETFGVTEAIKMMSRSDSYSLVIFDKDTKDMYFYRESNPLIWCIDRDTETLMFASTAGILDESVDKESLWGLSSPKCSPFQHTHENALYRVNTGVIEQLEEIKPRETDFELNKLPKEIKDQMELDEFIIKPSEVYQRRHYTAVDKVIRNTPSQNYRKPLVFTLISKHGVSFSAPFCASRVFTMGGSEDPNTFPFGERGFNGGD